MILELGNPLQLAGGGELGLAVFAMLVDEVGEL
jgi:hypothetical protein